MNKQEEEENEKRRLVEQEKRKQRELQEKKDARESEEKRLKKLQEKEEQKQKLLNEHEQVTNNVQIKVSSINLVKFFLDIYYWPNERSFFFITIHL